MKMTAEIRTCAGCAGPLVQREGELSSVFKKRKACCEKCRRKCISVGHTKIKFDFDRLCAFCGEALVPRESETPGRFAVRQTCSRNCGRKLAGVMSAKQTKQNLNCAVCSQPLLRWEGEQYNAFMKRQTCGTECKSIFVSARKRTRDPDRSCKGCGLQFFRRKNEQKSTFMRRKTCSKECFGKLISGRRQVVIDFYGEQLPVRIVAAILDVKAENLLNRMRYAARKASADASPTSDADPMTRDAPDPNIRDPPKTRSVLVTTVRSTDERAAIQDGDLELP
jgi:hypothetical protein